MRRCAATLQARNQAHEELNNQLGILLFWAVVIMVGAFLITVVFASTSAFAHSWYPFSCCGSNDCRPLKLDEVQVLPNGDYLVQGKFTVRRKDAAPSPDNDYHGCFPHERLGCFWAPQPST